MAKKFHIKPDGEAGVCRAFVKCPFGGADERANHYPHEEWARKAFERQMEREAEGQVGERPPSLANFDPNERRGLVGTYIYYEPSHEGYGQVMMLQGDEQGVYYQDGYRERKYLAQEEPYFNFYPMSEEQAKPALEAFAFNEDRRRASEFFPVDKSAWQERTVTYLYPEFTDYDFATGEFNTAKADENIRWFRNEGQAYANSYVDEVASKHDMAKWLEEDLDRQMEESGTIRYNLRGDLTNLAFTIRYGRDRGLIPADQVAHHLTLGAELIRSREDFMLANIRFKAEPLEKARAETQVWLDDLREGSVHRKPHEETMEKIEGQLADLQRKFDHHRALRDEAYEPYIYLASNGEKDR